MRECKIKNCIEYEDHLRIFGNLKSTKLSVVDKTVIESVLEETIDDNNSKKYFRFIYKNVLFHSCDYKRLTKRNSSCILTENSMLLIITGLVKIQCFISQDIKYDFGEKNCLLKIMNFAEMEDIPPTHFHLLRKKHQLLFAVKCHQL